MGGGVKKKVGRPVGSRSGYTVSPSAWHQRVVNNHNRFGGGRVYREVVKGLGLSGEHEVLLEEERLACWKRFQTPALMLMDEYVNLKGLVHAKLLAGADPTGKDLIAMSKLLLDISKELNRLTSVSADKKFEVFSRSFSTGGDDLVVDVSGGVGDCE